MNLNQSKQLFNEAIKYMPGGVSSPVRSFKNVGGTPPFIRKGLGNRIWDVDGNEYMLPAAECVQMRQRENTVVKL